MKVKARAQKKLVNDPRFQAVRILTKIDEEGAYSNVLLNDFYQDSEHALKTVDMNLLVKLVYGVLQRKKTLDFYLAPLIQGKTLEVWLVNLLRLSIYQIIYLDRIPNHAIINEAVKISKLNSHQGLANLVNGVLRNFLRQQPRSLDSIEDPIQFLSMKYSMDAWIVEDLASYMGLDRLESLLISLLQPPYLSARLVDPNLSQAQAIGILEREGFSVEAGRLSAKGIRAHGGNLVHSSLYREGRLTIQDESSMLVAPLGKLQGDERVLDACSAPGGKATHIAQFLDKGHLTALDISEYKLQRVHNHLERLALDQRAETILADAGKFMPADGELYDRIYLDAPCSGLGLMRRKPEIKYEKRQEDIRNLADLQASLLEHLHALLKPGGYLIYSTCTLSRLENENQMDSFQERHPNFQVDPISKGELGEGKENILTPQGWLRIWPDDYQTDGFFIARLKKTCN